MDIGKLNCRVTIQQRAAGQDATGKPNGSWVPLATVYAKISEQSGSEAVVAARGTSFVQARITMRRRSDVTAAMRVVYGTRVYQVLSVLRDDYPRQALTLDCEVVQ